MQALAIGTLAGLCSGHGCGPRLQANPASDGDANNDHFLFLIHIFRGGHCNAPAYGDVISIDR